MSKKAFIILLILIASLSIIALLNSANKGGGHKNTNNMLLDFNLEAVESISIRDNDFSIELSKAEQKWLVHNKNNFPAKTASVNNLLLNLSELSSTQVITRNKNNYEKLGLDKETALNVTLLDAQNKILSSLEIGRKRTVKGQEMSESFVKPGNSDTVFLVADNLNIQKENSYWLESEILKLPADIIKEIRFLEGETPFVITTDKTDKEISFKLSPLKEGYEVKQWLVNNIANMFKSLQLNDLFEAEGFEAGKEGFVKLIEVETITNRLWSFAGTEKEGEFYIKISLDNSKVEKMEKDAEGKVYILPSTDFNNWVFKLDSWVAGNFKKIYKDLIEEKKAEEAPIDTTNTKDISAEEESAKAEEATTEVFDEKENKSQSSLDPESPPAEPEL